MQHFITVTEQIAVISDILYVTSGIAKVLLSMLLKNPQNQFVFT